MTEKNRPSKPRTTPCSTAPQNTNGITANMG